MSVNSKRKCDYCHKEMEIGKDISKPIKFQRLADRDLICDDTKLVIGLVAVGVEAAEGLDICHKCAMGYALTQIKKEIARYK